MVAAEFVRVAEDLRDGEVIGSRRVDGDGRGTRGGNYGLRGACKSEYVSWVCVVDAVECEVLLRLKLVSISYNGGSLERL